MWRDLFSIASRSEWANGYDQEKRFPLEHFEMHFPAMGAGRKTVARQ